MALETFELGDEVPHGVYGRIAATRLTRHFYGTTGADDAVSGFLEVLEIHDYAPGCWPVVVHVRLNGADCVAGFATVAAAMAAKDRVWCGRPLRKGHEGFLGQHNNLWFYQPLVH